MASMSREDTRPVTYDIFWTFLMSQEIGLKVLWSTIRDFTTGKSVRSKTTRILIILTMSFVMAWPTLASAMTGYNSLTTAVIKTKDGLYVPFSSFQPVLYMIHDGSRVGLTDEYIVPYCISYGKTLHMLCICSKQ